MAERVIVTVGPTGEITVEADGVVGSGCGELTKAFRDGLGEQTSDRKKPEYYKRADQANQQSAGK